jgi:hypothetical protein
MNHLALLATACPPRCGARTYPAKGPYQTVTTIRANAEACTKPISTSFLAAALDQMAAQVAKDPVLSVPVAQECERVVANKFIPRMNARTWARVRPYLSNNK